MQSSVERLAHCLDVARLAQQEALLDQGLAAAVEAWELARQQGYLSEQLEAGRLRASFLYRRGEMAEMLAVAQPVIALMRPLGATSAYCELLRFTSLAAADLGEFELALNCANEACACAQELGDKRLQAVTLNALGVCFDSMGDPWQAERLMNEAAALAREESSAYERVVTLNNLCSVALGEFYLLQGGGHEVDAQRALQRALSYARDLRPHAQEFGERFVLALSEANLGEVHLHLGELEAARPHLEAALTQAEAQNFMAVVWRARGLMALRSLAQGDPSAAWTQLVSVLQEAGDKLSHPLALLLNHNAYRCAKLLGDDRLALHHLERYQQLERGRSVAQLLAQSRFFVTRLEAEQVRAQVVQAHQDLDQLQARAQELEAHAQRDPLTGLGNRRFLEARMPALMQDAEQRGRPLTVALIDADRFKSINDSHGHAVGDRVLQILSQMLRDNTRASDLLLRLGGEEFLVVLPDTVPDRAFEVCERLRQSVELFPWSDLAPGLEVTLSIGLASAPPYSTDQLISRADAAMYRAKHLGRNRVALA